MKNELIGKNGKGVPAEIFSGPQFLGTVTGGSGSHLHCYVGDEAVSIEPNVEHPPYYFSAFVSQGVIGFVAFTKTLKEGVIEQHPDLFAAQLIGKTLRYFREQHGHEIHTIHDIWKRPLRGKVLSDNYWSFVNATGNTQTASPSVLLNAIQQTPSHRIYQPLGFSAIEPPNIEWKDELPKSVDVDFTLLG